ncbi:MAG: hypothetical protein HGA58_08900 [Chlorobiaceae bacterium]|nr:hypothetical protein [Chlorobiaceae bacterium]
MKQECSRYGAGGEIPEHPASENYQKKQLQEKNSDEFRPVMAETEELKAFASKKDLKKKKV